jgi:hypothetical protein
LPQLKPLVLGWQQAMTQMALRLLRAFAQALSLPENAFDALYGDKPNEHIKLIRYPGRHARQSRQGVGAHKDSGFLSFLLQDEQAGLQVEVEEGRWIDASPRPDTLVVNIGELLELASNGYLRATVHRVVSPPAGSERLSLAFSSARNWTPWCRFTNWRRNCCAMPTAPPAIRATRCCAMWAGTTSRAACARTPMSPSASTPTPHFPTLCPPDQEITMLKTALTLAALLASLSVSAADALRVAADPIPHAQILEYVQKLDPGLNLKIIEIPSGVNSNELLAHGDVDANYFQHLPYLNSQEQALGQKFAVAATVHIEPLGIYSIATPAWPRCPIKAPWPCRTTSPTSVVRCICCRPTA